MPKINQIIKNPPHIEKNESPAFTHFTTMKTQDPNPHTSSPDHPKLGATTPNPRQTQVVKVRFSVTESRASIPHGPYRPISQGRQVC